MQLQRKVAMALKNTVRAVQLMRMKVPKHDVASDIVSKELLFFLKMW